MASNSEWLQLLKRVNLFSSCTEGQLTLLSKKMTLVSLPKGAVLFSEGDTGDSLIIVVSGSLRLLDKPRAGGKSARQNDTLAFLNRGDVMGEMSLMNGDQRSNTVVADATSEILVLYKTDFDKILEKNPTLAVHLSRSLSNQLSSMYRHGVATEQKARLFCFVSAIPLRDHVVFAVNAGLSLTEQTRRKVLLCVNDAGDNAIPKSLGLEGKAVSEQNIRDGFFESQREFEKHVMIHPSGLEILSLESRVFAGAVQGGLASFLTIVRDNYDFCLFVFPSALTDALRLFFQESNRILSIAAPHSAPEDIDTLKKIPDLLPPSKKLERIWLSLGPEFHPGDYVPDIRFPWDLEWGRGYASTGSPYFPTETNSGHHAMDRMARSLGGLRIGFAMGSGAAFGYSLIGMLRVFEREGIYPDIISGTSMGALIGAFYAAGISPDEMEKIALSISRRKMWMMADPNVGNLFRSGLVGGHGVLDFLRSHLGDRTFKDLNMPFSCVATDIQTGKEIVLNDGSVAEAVRASLSLPFFFQPYYLNGRYLVDGGLVNPVPTSIIVDQGANILIAANLTSKASERRVPRVMGWRRRLPSLLRGPNVMEIMMKTIYIMQYEIAAARSELAHVLLQIKAHDYLWWDLDHARDIIRLGEASAEESIPKIKSLLPFHSTTCKIRVAPRNRKSY